MSKSEYTGRHCQWLFGEPRERNFCTASANPGEVWCKEHKRQVYVAGSAYKPKAPPRPAVAATANMTDRALAA